MSDIEDNSSVMIFCLSSLDIPDTLSVLSHSKDFIIITHNQQVRNFLITVYDKNKVQLIKSPFPKIGYYLPFSFLESEYLKYKYWWTYRKVKGFRIYANFVAFAYIEAWLVKKLSARNVIVKTERTKVTGSISKSRIDRLNSKLLNWIFSIPTIPISDGYRTRMFIKKSFFDSINAVDYVCAPHDSNEIGLELLKRFGLEDCKLLFLTGGVIEGGLIKESVYLEITSKLFSIVNNDDVVVKVHPRYSTLYGQEKKLRLIPSYIPANLLIRNFTVVIGFNTATLFEAANSGITSISLLRLIEKEKTNEVNAYFNYLNLNLIDGAHIHFPSSFIELDEILNRLLKTASS